MKQTSQAHPPASPYNSALSGNSASATSRAYPNGNPADSLNPPDARTTDSSVPLHRTGPIVHDYHPQGPAPGAIGFRWIYGSNIAARNRDPRIQVMEYNEDTYLMRQNICVHWEGPFTYLLFGNRGALLIDTGATANPAWYPLRKIVDAIIARWAGLRGRPVVPLTIILSSAEDIAQNRGVAQFAQRPHTTIERMPTAGTIDLGERVVSVLPTPGAHKDGLSLYDPYTRLLFTGDLLYPGKIQIANDRDYIASLERLHSWRATHPVKWVMGGHIEMQFLPGKAYPRFYTYKPYERLLQMEPQLIDDALTSARQVSGKQMVLVRPDFHLLNGVSPDQKTLVFPEGVPNLNAPRPF